MVTMVLYSSRCTLISKKKIMDALINANKARAGTKKEGNDPKNNTDEMTIYPKNKVYPSVNRKSLRNAYKKAHGNISAENNALKGIIFGKNISVAKMRRSGVILVCLTPALCASRNKSYK